jgi:hypothetical protein
MRRTLVSWTSLFALVTVVAGGCDGRTPEPIRRMPRVVESTSELFVIDEADSAKVRSTEELIGDWTPPAKIETLHAPAPVAHKRPAFARERPPPSENVEPRSEVEPPPRDAPPETKAPVQAERPTVAPPREDPGWYTPPAPGPHSTAINVALAVGAISVGLGTTAAASSDGAPGDRAFLFTTLGIGAASFGTALVLHLTEPETKTKAGANVTLGPGMIGLRGTF